MIALEIQLQLEGNVKAVNLNTATTYSGKLALNKANLRKLLPELGIDLPENSDSQTLQSLTGQLDFQGDQKQLNLPKLLFR